jgi:hypothetical protein
MNKSKLKPNMNYQFDKMFTNSIRLGYFDKESADLLSQENTFLKVAIDKQYDDHSEKIRMTGSYENETINFYMSYKDLILPDIKQTIKKVKFDENNLFL